MTVVNAKQKPQGWDRRLLIVLFGVLGLAVLLMYGLHRMHSRPRVADNLDRNLEDVTEREVIELGYDVPSGAQHIYIRDRATREVRGSWIRYDLDRAALAELRTQIETLPGVASADGIDSPSDWPDHDDDRALIRPSWFLPPRDAEAYRSERRQGERDFDGNTTSHTSGNAWFLDSAEGRVFVHLWYAHDWQLAD